MPARLAASTARAMAAFVGYWETLLMLQGPLCADALTSVHRISAASPVLRFEYDSGDRCQALTRLPTLRFGAPRGLGLKAHPSSAIGSP